VEGLGQVVTERPGSLTEGTRGDTDGKTSSNDGTWMGGGASWDSTLAACNGAANVFQFDPINDEWQFCQKLVPMGTHSLDFAGLDVAVSGDWIMLGAYSDDQQGYNAGAVYVFKFDGVNWQHHQVLRPADPTAEMYFGYNLAVDGDLALVGAFQDSSVGFGNDSGSAYAFALNGTQWQQIQKITPADGQNGAHFGRAVAVSGDLALVGANLHTTSVNQGGKAYAYAFNGSQFDFLGDVLPADQREVDRFAFSISMHDNQALISKHRDDSTGLNGGSAYVFEFVDGGWEEVQKIIPVEVFIDDFFGLDLALNEGCLLIANRNQGLNGQNAGGVSL